MHAIRSEVQREIARSPQRSTDGINTQIIYINTRSPSRSLAPPLSAVEDADGDLELPRKRRRRELPPPLFTLETLTSGTVESTGMQLWRASLLLTEFIHQNQTRLEHAVVLELGCGVGLVSLAAADSARVVFATDCDSAALAICRQNVQRNSQNMDRVRTRWLDWQHPVASFKGNVDETIPDNLRWTDNDQELINAGVDWIFASDVFYDDEIADCFLDTLHYLLTRFPNATAVIATEKRIVFSAVTMSEISLGVDAFEARLCPHDPTTLQQITPGTKYCSVCAASTSSLVTRFAVKRISIEDEIPHILDYHRESTLEIMHVFALITTMS